MRCTAAFSSTWRSRSSESYCPCWKKPGHPGDDVLFSIIFVVTNIVVTHLRLQEVQYGTDSAGSGGEAGNHNVEYRPGPFQCAVFRAPHDDLERQRGIYQGQRKGPV